MRACRILPREGPELCYYHRLLPRTSPCTNAVVYRARDLKHDRDVAIKVLKPAVNKFLDQWLGPPVLGNQLPK